MSKLILQNMLSFVCFAVLHSTVATGHIQLFCCYFPSASCHWWPESSGNSGIWCFKLL